MIRLRRYDQGFECRLGCSVFVFIFLENIFIGLIFFFTWEIDGMDSFCFQFLFFSRFLVLLIFDRFQVVFIVFSFVMVRVYRVFRVFQFGYIYFSYVFVDLFQKEFFLVVLDKVLGQSLFYDVVGDVDNGGGGVLFSDEVRV